ncbi:MAG: cupin domain-containing protein [Telluria sp.]
MLHNSQTQARIHEFHGVRFESRANPSIGASENALWTVTIPPGTPGALHQVTREESFYILSGSGEARVGARSVRLVAGDVLVVPPQTDFSLAAGADEALRALVVFPVGGQAVLPGGAPFTPPWAL